MATNDNNQRNKAIPYYGQIVGYNRAANSDQDISITSINPGTGVAGGNAALLGNGDLFPIITAVSQTDYMIRILRPKFGHIIQAYLNIGLTFAASEPNPKFRISVGSDFQADQFTANTPNNTFITSCMNILSPNVAYFTGTAGKPITIYKLNIQPLLPQVGSANYVPDFYAIGLHFVTAPVMTGTFHLSKLFITGSILVT